MATDQTAQLQAIIDRDPVLQGLLRQYRTSHQRGNLLDPTFRQINERTKQLLGPGGLPEDYSIDPKTGKVQRANYFTRNADWIVPAAVGAAGGIGGLLGGGAAAGNSLGGGLASAGSATGTAAGPFSASGLIAAASGPGTGALSDPNFWAMLGGMGLQLYGADKAADAANDAARYQAEALEKALALQKDMYAQDRADHAPYRAAGQGSVGKLGYLLGVPGFESGPTAHAPSPGPFDQPRQNTAISPSLPSGNLGLLGGQMPNGMTPSPGVVAPQMPQSGGPQGLVTLQAPDGTTKQFPDGPQVQFLISRGARRIA